MNLESFLSVSNITKKVTNDRVLRAQTIRKTPTRNPVKRGAKKAKVYYTADFETTTFVDDCRVWAWGLSNIETPDYKDVEIGNTIDGFMERISQSNSGCYFHNLKFDGHFILDWLLKNDYHHVQTDVLKRDGTFKTLISDMGAFYSITVKWDTGHTTEFRDSLKKLPMSVKRVADSFKLPMSKGDLDYETFREIGHELTDDEEDYLRRDVSIIAQAMKTVHDNGMRKLTVAADAMAEYKNLMGADNFKRTFPVLGEYMDSEIRRAYRGGFTYCDPRFKGEITRSGLVLDVNSLYPSVMMQALLPHGEPKWFNAKFKPTLTYPLGIFSVTFTAKIKPNHIPTIQIKGNSRFTGTAYLSEITEPVTLMMTNVDFDLYSKHYDLDVLEYGGGWAFHASHNLFDDYINKWSAIKESSTGGQREIAKLHLNTLYGKFASNPNVTGKIPKLRDDRVKLVVGEPETRDSVYTAMGVFITSYARQITISAAQTNYDVFAYADTDSLHLLVDTIPPEIDIHPTRMGAWKLEYYFDAAFYIRAKGYLERTKEPSCRHNGDELEHGEHCRFVVHIAGMPTPSTEFMTFADMEDGKIFHGKLNPKTVPGGIVLLPIQFQLKL